MTELESRAAVPLRTLPAVELAAVGTWRAQTGETTFTHEDLAGAIAALDCPGIRNPVLKLGHSEDDSTGGVRWDGEPAVGWVANLRMSENGTKLIGDYTGVPEWLAEVMPSAYPDRSIEIYRPLRCQIGHYHPSVITAVALLGVMPPGVGVLQSLQDVYAAFTVTDQQGDRAEASAPVRVLMPVRLAAARGPLVLRRNPSDVEKAAAFDPGAVQDAWTDELEELIADWQAEVDPDARADLLDQIEEQMASEDGISTLAEVAVGAAVVTAGAALLAAAMLSAGETAADLMLAEMQAQGLPPVAPADLDDEWLRERAAGTARTLLAGLATSAGRRALSLADPDATPGSVRDGVAEHLESLTDRALRDQLGAALTAAQNAGRITVLVNAPPARYVSSEIVDANACTACVAVDGTEFDSLAAAKAAYLSGGYVGCLGRDRCRGMVVAVWGDVPARAAAPDARGRGVLPSLVQIRYGDHVVVARLAYNPDQPRDKIGRWGKGVAGHPDFEGMTDTEFDARAASVSEHVGGARKTLSTDVTHTNDVGAWTAERDRLHREIVDDLYERDSQVPNDGRAVIAGGLGGAGKALGLGVEIPTPAGFTTMGALSIGDQILGSDGKPVTVTFATDVMRDRPCYRVAFDDGTSVIADADHEWSVTGTLDRMSVSTGPPAPLQRRTARIYSAAYPDDATMAEWASAESSMAALASRIGVSRGSLRDYLARRPALSAVVREAFGLASGGDLRSRRAPRPGSVGTWSERVMTTAGLLDSGLHHVRPDGRSEARWAVKVAGPAQHDGGPLPVPAYVLGAWLGDGDSRAPMLTSMDPQITDRIAATGWPVVECRYPSNVGRSGKARRWKVFAPGDALPPAGLIGVDPAARRYYSSLVPALRSLGVFGAKRIPGLYLAARESDRRELLAGLMDTDGTIDVRRGRRVVFGHVVNRQLAADVHTLVSGLGYKATTTTKVINGRPYYAVGFTTSDPVFTLTRKRDLQRPAPEKFSGRRADLRYIVAVEPVPSEPVRCIQVDADDHLYLATRAYVPTHNTTVLTKHAGVDTSEYMTVNPDDIKEELARRGMIPAVPDAPDLSPMERASLVHEESSRIASMLADRAYREKRNIIWDITMSSESSVKSRVAALQKAGYGEINGVFVDIPVETSVERAMARYRRGVDQYLGGKGFGGRYVPPEIIRAQETSSGMTLNRQVFDGLREQFTESSVYDNSVTGKPPRKVG